MVCIVFTSWGVCVPYSVTNVWDAGTKLYRCVVDIKMRAVRNSFVQGVTIKKRLIWNLKYCSSARTQCHIWKQKQMENQLSTGQLVPWLLNTTGAQISLLAFKPYQSTVGSCAAACPCHFHSYCVRKTGTKSTVCSTIKQHKGFITVAPL